MESKIISTEAIYHGGATSYSTKPINYNASAKQGGLSSLNDYRWKDLNDPVSVSDSDIATSSLLASGVNTTLTYAAQQYGTHVLYGIQWSYSATPNPGFIQIKDGSTTLFDHAVTSAGTDGLNFENPIKGTKNTAMQIILGSGGGPAVVESKISARHEVM